MRSHVLLTCAGTVRRTLSRVLTAGDTTGRSHVPCPPAPSRPCGLGGHSHVGGVRLGGGLCVRNFAVPWHHGRRRLRDLSQQREHCVAANRVNCTWKIFQNFPDCIRETRVTVPPVTGQHVPEEEGASLKPDESEGCSPVSVWRSRLATRYIKNTCKATWEGHQTFFCLQKNKNCTFAGVVGESPHRLWQSSKSRRASRGEGCRRLS